MCNESSFLVGIVVPEVANLVVLLIKYVGNQHPRIRYLICRTNKSSARLSNNIQNNYHRGRIFNIVFVITTR